MSTTQNTTTATRTGNEITITFPDGETATTRGKAAARAAAVIIGERHEYDYSQGTPGNRPWAGWEWGWLGVRASVAAAQREAVKYSMMPDHFRNMAAVLVTER